jgi:hypothetical protein
MASIAYWNGTSWVTLSSGGGGGGSITPGPQGPKGDKGDKGDDGKSVAVTKSTTQPASAELGDVWIQD